MYSNECQRVNTQRNSNIESNVLELLKEVKDIKHQLVQYNYHVRMDTVSIAHLFPLKSDDDLKTFLEQDEEWNQRRKVFYSNPTKFFKIFEYQNQSNYVHEQYSICLATDFEPLQL